MKKTTYKAYDEIVYKFTLRQRLDIYVLRKRRFAKTYVTLSAPLGSVHRRYKDESGAVRTVPPGVAHFLEHKIFERAGRDISADFSMDEAQINAFTDHHRTTYLFHATDKVFANIERLLEMCFYPDFSQDGVEKERNIISEELNMHLDDPHYRQFHGLLNNLYCEHPLREDILGTKESIDKVSVEDLRSMHEAFYQPEHAVVVVVGDVDPYVLEDYLDKRVTLPGRTFKEPLPPTLQEPAGVEREHQEERLDVLTPSLLLGVKLSPRLHGDKKARIREKIILSILLDLQFGRSSETYESMLESGLINDTFGLDIVYEDTYAHILAGSETNEPEALKQKLHDLLEQLPGKDAAFNKDDFERVKRRMVGSFLMGLDNLEALSQQFTSHLSHGVYFHDVLDLAQSISYEEVEAQRRRLDLSARSTYIVHPDK